MSINILAIWVFYYFLVTVTGEKLGAINFRTLPQKSDKLTVPELSSYNLFEPYGAGTYAFGYEIEDAASQNIQFRDEEKLQNGTVRGSYGLVRPNGLISITRYIADETGYHSSTQTFNQNNQEPTILTSTASPFLDISSPSDVNYLSVPNPATLSPAVAQEILEQHKVELATPSSNIPITETFSATGEDSDSDSSGSDKKAEKLSTLSSTQSTIENKVTIFPELISKPASDETISKFEITTKQPNPSLNMTNILESLLPHIPKLPVPQSTTQSSQGSHSSTIISDLSDENSSTSNTPSNNDLPQLPNIFETILPHVPQFPILPNVMVSTTLPTTPSSNDSSDVTQNESLSPTNSISNNFPQLSNIFESLLPHVPQLPSPSQTTSTTESLSTSAAVDLSPVTENQSPSSTQNTNDFPEFPNIFETLLPHIPEIPILSQMVSTTESSSAASDLADENESETPTSPDQTMISSPTSGGDFPQVPPIFSFWNPENFPIFKPPTNVPPNKQDNTNTPTTETAMDTIFDSTPQTIEPMFAIIHKNATVIPLYDDKGNPTGIQLINSFIPSNFHIIPFIIPTNYFQTTSNSEAQTQNIAHDEVAFEDGPANFVNDKFHDPLNDIDSSWKAKLAPKNKGRKRSKIRRNSIQKRRLRCRD